MHCEYEEFKTFISHTLVVPSEQNVVKLYLASMTQTDEIMLMCFKSELKTIFYYSII